MISQKEVNRKFKDLVKAKYDGEASVSQMINWLIEKQVIPSSTMEIILIREEYYKRAKNDKAKNAKMDTAIEFDTSVPKVEGAIYYHKHLNL